MFARLPRIVVTCVALACAAASVPAQGASSNPVVGATVLSATLLDASGCRSGTAATAFGPLGANSWTIAGSDCTIAFSSSNDTARLELNQGDGSGTTLATTSATNARLQDDMRVLGVGARTATDAWASGQAGTITHWDGSTWTPVASGSGTTFRDITAGSASRVWVVGAGAIIRTSTTGGASWSQEYNGGAGTFNAVDSTDATHAWAVGTGGMIVRFLTAPPWTPATNPTTEDLKSVVAIDDTVIVAVGNGGRILRSNDGGASFAPVASGTTYDLDGVAMRDPLTLYASGSAGTLLRSGDAGLTWTPIGNVPASYAYNAVAAPGAQDIVLFTEHGAVVRSTDDGASWITDNSGYHNSVVAADTVGGTTFAVGDGSMFLTSGDAGDTWTAAPSFRPTVYGVYATSRLRAWAVGARGMIRATTDGTTFADQPSGTLAELRDIDGAGAGTLWAAGSGGTIVASTNGGASWSPQTSGITADIRKVDAVTEHVAWLAGGTSRVASTTNGGATWTTHVLPGSTTVYTVSAANHLVAWASGSNGYLVRTTDGGQTWSPITTPATYSNENARVSGAEATGLRLVLTGSDGSVHTTTDGGATWTPVAGVDGVYSTINAVDAHDTNAMALAVGSASVTATGDGTTWRTATAGSPTRGNNDVSFPSVHAVWTGTDSWGVLRADAGGAAIADYADDPTDVSGNDWGTPGAAFFGACLRNLTGASELDWVRDANTTCTNTDSDPWRPIIATSGAAGTPVARTTVAGATGTATITFAIRTGNVAAGDYAGSIRINVIAPNTA